MPTTYKIVYYGGVRCVKPAPDAVITDENKHEYTVLPSKFEEFIIDFFDDKTNDSNPTLYKKGSKNRIKITDFYGRSAYIMKSYLEDIWIDSEFREWIKETYC